MTLSVLKRKVNNSSSYGEIVFGTFKQPLEKKSPLEALPKPTSEPTPTWPRPPLTGTPGAASRHLGRS